MTDRFVTLTFERAVAAPVETLWPACVTPGARALWSAPSSEVMVEYLSHATMVGERETSLCKMDGEPVVQVDAGGLTLQPNARSVNYEVVSSEGGTLSAARITADVRAVGLGSQITVTV